MGCVKKMNWKVASSGACVGFLIMMGSLIMQIGAQPERFTSNVTGLYMFFGISIPVGLIACVAIPFWLFKRREREEEEAW